MTNLDNLLQAESPASSPDNVDSFTCGLCRLTCNCLLEFIQHKLLHENPERRFSRCYLCERTFKDLKTLFLHFQLQHGIFKSNYLKNNEIQDNKLELSSTQIAVNKSKENIKNVSTDLEENEESFPNVFQKDPVDSSVMKECTLHVNIIQKDSIKNDFHFMLIAEFVQGKKIKYKRITFKCLHCDLKTYSRLTLCKHMKEKHQEMIGILPSIDIIKEELDEKHRLMSMLEYISQFCQKKPHDQLKKVKKCKKFIDKRDHAEAFSCDVCSKTFSKQKYLRKHSIIHKTENTFSCDECGKKFKSKTYLQVHVRRHGDRTYSCSQCDFRSNIKASILAHRQVHRAGSVLCEICGFAYMGKQTLSKHMEVHDLSRPFGCTFPGCSWRFKTEVMCKAHVKAHTTEGTFKCSMCGYLFRRKHHLQRHERKMHGIQVTKSSCTWKDQCSLKEKAYVSSHNLCMGLNSETDSLLNKVENELHELMKNDDLGAVLIPQIDSNHGVEIACNQSDVKNLEIDSFPIETVDEVHGSAFLLNQRTHFADKNDLLPMSVEEMVRDPVDTLIGATAIVIDNGQILLESNLSMDI